MRQPAGSEQSKTKRKANAYHLKKKNSTSVFTKILSSLVLVVGFYWTRPKVTDPNSPLFAFLFVSFVSFWRDSRMIIVSHLRKV